MVKIERLASGFKVSFSDEGQRFSVIARDVVSIHAALSHYYNTDDDMCRDGRCPICQKYPESKRRT